VSKETCVLKLFFTDEIEPELVRTYVKFPRVKQIELENRQNRSNFRWSEAPCAFSLCVLDYLIWSFARPPEDFEFMGVAGDSPASTLHDAVSKTDHPFHKFFGYTSSGTPRVRQILKPRSPRQSQVDRRVIVKPETLSTETIEIWSGQRRLTGENELRQLSRSVRRFWDSVQPLAIERESRRPASSHLGEIASTIEVATELPTASALSLPSAVYSDSASGYAPSKTPRWVGVGMVGVILVVAAALLIHNFSDQEEGVTLSPAQKLLLEPNIRGHISTTASILMQQAMTNPQSAITVYKEGMRIESPEQVAASSNSTSPNSASEVYQKHPVQ
jgi:hypothetical protein